MPKFVRNFLCIQKINGPKFCSISEFKRGYENCMAEIKLIIGINAYPVALGMLLYSTLTIIEMFT